ncbi:MAG: HIT domain-containing protein [Fimbriimonadaceae bacterium]|nr:HIT domain-containing protein [Fimbriimonadaceae bacterium]
MDRLWAPWRMSYITAPKEATSECVFCRAAAAGDDAAYQVLMRGQLCYAILNRYPYNNGHLMVVPYDHVADLTEVSDAGLAEMLQLAARWTAVLRQQMRCAGFNLGFNLGSAAGAGIRDHLHLHLVPRWDGDTNFMPVVGEAKVLPETLDETWQKLSAAWVATQG